MAQQPAIFTNLAPGAVDSDDFYASRNDQPFDNARCRVSQALPR